LFKYDLHIHTSETSSCAKVSATDMIKIYKNEGYQGVVITDHFKKFFFKNSKGNTWEEKVDDFLKGYRAAKEEGKKQSMDVLLGMEIAFMEYDEPGNDYLVYGITEEILKEMPNLLEIGIEGLSEFCREKGLLLYQAHPLRKNCRLVDINLLDGVEVHNGNPRHDSHNDEIQKIAEENNLKMTSGSDYHELGDESNGGIITPKRIRTNEDLIEVLHNSEYELYRGKTK